MQYRSVKIKLHNRAIAAIFIAAMALVFILTGCREKASPRIEPLDVGEVASVTLVYGNIGKGKEITGAEDVRAICEWFNTADMRLYEKKREDDVPAVTGGQALLFYFHLSSGETRPITCSAGSYVYQYNDTYVIQSDEYEKFWDLDYETQSWVWDEERLKPLDDRRIAPLDAESVESITLVDGNLGKSKEIAGAENIRAVCDLLNTTEMEFNEIWTDMGFRPAVTRDALFFYFHLSSGETARIVYYEGQALQDGYGGGDVYRISTRKFEDFWALDYAEQDWDWDTEYAWIREAAQADAGETVGTGGHRSQPT